MLKKIIASIILSLSISSSVLACDNDQPINDQPINYKSFKVIMHDSTSGLYFGINYNRQEYIIFDDELVKKGDKVNVNDYVLGKLGNNNDIVQISKE